MRKIREVMRLKYDRGLSHRQISAASGISRSTVSEYVQRAERAGLTWEAAQGLSDAEVEQRLFRYLDRHEPSIRAPVDFGWVHMELRKKGVTLQLLWTEYQEMVVDGSSGQRPYQYSQFCDLYRDYRGRLKPTMRQVHRAGEKAFIDFSGKKPRIIDSVTGKATEVELYVMVLGASSYAYAEATRTQRLEDFVGATGRGLEYFGGVPEMLVPDQLKSAVRKPDWCEPEINATFAEMGQHYGTAIVPARPGKPRDKAKVEVGVLIVQRWILACLRNRRFFSLEELNAAIRELLEKLNNKPFQKLEGCRRSVFESIDRPAMRALPPRRYELGRWKLNVAVNIDYHVEYDHRYYSAPCELVQDRVDVRATAQVVELWRGGLRITSHERSYGPKGTAVTKPEHRPRSHREFGDWPPERLVGWAGKTGPRAAEVVEAILSRGPHPESGRRACLALVRMADRYGSERLEAACARAIRIGNPTRKSVQAILKSGLDKFTPVSEVEVPVIVHENIRGGEYFDRPESLSSHGEEIEAGYLDEERLGIMNDSLTGTAQPLPQDSLRQERSVATERIVERPSGPARAKTLPALIERLKDLWARPETAVRAVPEARHATLKGPLIQTESAHCTNLTDCAPAAALPENNNANRCPVEQSNDAPPTIR
jgi:transposase